MTQFDDILAVLQARNPLLPLYPTQPFNPNISEQIQGAADEELFGSEPLLLEQKQALRCGLLLMNDDLHASHDISQSIKTPTGSFWHAIMHRREGDASNANYWWRLTGEHPAFADIFHEASKYLEGATDAQAKKFAAQMQQSAQWNPVDFTRACSNAHGNDGWLRGLQMVEISTLLGWCRHNS